MQENSESKKPEGSDNIDDQENVSDSEETTPPEYPEADLSQSDSQFEEQEGEVLLPEEKKKSGSGKAIIFLILILGVSGGYLYFNNLIPAEVLNFISPQPVQTKSPALVVQIPPTPLPIEDEAIELRNAIPVPSAIETIPQATESQETTHISGSSAEALPETRISGNNFSPVPEAETVEKPEEDLQEEADIEEPEQTIEHEQEVTKSQEVTQEPVSEAVVPSLEEAEPSPPVVERTEATQAYIDFIELSVQKLGELIKVGFIFGWDFIQKKLG